MAKAVKAGNKGSKDAGEKLPLTKKTAAALNLPIKRLGAITDRMRKWNLTDEIKEVITALDEAVARLEDSKKSLEEIPDTYQHKIKGVKRTLEIGQVVSVRDARKDIYTDLIDAKELDGLKVKRVGGKHVLVETTGGSQLTLPRGHIQVAA